MAFGDSDVSQASASAQRSITVAGGGYSLTGGGGTTSFDQLVQAPGSKAEIAPDTAAGIATALPLVAGALVLAAVALIAWLVFRKK